MAAPILRALSWTLHIYLQIIILNDRFWPVFGYRAVLEECWNLKMKMMTTIRTDLGSRWLKVEEIYLFRAMHCLDSGTLQACSQLLFPFELSLGFDCSISTDFLNYGISRCFQGEQSIPHFSEAWKLFLPFSAVTEPIPLQVWIGGWRGRWGRGRTKIPLFFDWWFSIVCTL